MSGINVWLAVSAVAQAVVRQCIEDEDKFKALTANQKKAVRVLRKVHDLSGVEGLWKKPTIATKVYHLWNVYIDSDDAARAAAAISDVVDHFPTHVAVLGAWRTATGNRIQSVPLHAQILKFMPDVWDEATQAFVPATELTDVNLLWGQAPRNFGA